MYSIFSSTELALLFRLILSHLLTDFIFQSDEWVDDKRINKGKSKYLYLHGSLTAVLLGKYEAIGFLITAKSILRFRQDTEMKQSEYVLVGTLLSYGSAILLGLVVSQMIRV